MQSTPFILSSYFLDLSKDLRNSLNNEVCMQAVTGKSGEVISTCRLPATQNHQCHRQIKKNLSRCDKMPFDETGYCKKHTSKKIVHTEIEFPWNPWKEFPDLNYIPILNQDQIKAVFWRENISATKSTTVWERQIRNKPFIANVEWRVGSNGELQIRGSVERHMTSNEANLVDLTFLQPSPLIETESSSEPQSANENLTQLEPEIVDIDESNLEDEIAEFLRMRYYCPCVKGLGGCSHVCALMDWLLYFKTEGKEIERKSFPLETQEPKVLFVRTKNKPPKTPRTIQKKAKLEVAEVISCVCDEKDIEKGAMISCDSCLVWYHMECLGILENLVPEKWNCSKCRKGEYN